MVSLDKVTKSYRLGKTIIPALKGVSVKIEQGEFVCFMGPSGSGKSTLLNIIGCLDKPDSGTVTVNGESVKELSRDRLAEIRANTIGFIFQSFNLISVLNVYENIEFPLFLKSGHAEESRRREWIHKLIAEVGLEEHVRHKPDELSGGQRQRVAIARALVTRPEIILADEPTANLDSATGRSIIQLMNRLNREEGTTFIFSTHDPSITEFASKTYHLKDGVLHRPA
jgi:putative ABC transport system ATP-binding protein